MQLDSRSTIWNDFIRNALIYKRRNTKSDGKNRMRVKEMIRMVRNELCGCCRFEVMPFGGAKAGVSVGFILEALAKLGNIQEIIHI